jgi:hypothetical protein
MKKPCIMQGFFCCILPPLTVSLRREREKKGRRELEKGEEIW